MATEKRRLSVVAEDDTPRVTRRESPVQLFERAMKGATNDEALELGYRLLEQLADRAENAADIGIDSDSRDVENEALVFVNDVKELIPTLTSVARLSACWHKVHDAEEDLATAARNRRARLDGKWSRVEEFSRRRRARVLSAWSVEMAREKRQSEATLQRADITAARVLKAIRASDGSVQAKDIAVALLPALADTSIVGRQMVINRVSQVMRALVRNGKVVQHRPDDNDGGRKTCRYEAVTADAR